MATNGEKDRKDDKDNRFRLGQVSFGLSSPQAAARGERPDGGAAAARGEIDVRDAAAAAAETRDLMPLRVLVLADLTPGDQYNAGASAPEHAIRIDPGRFDDLFQKLRPRVAFEVPSVLGEGASARLDLSLTSLGSFRPDGLCEQVPLLRSLLDGKTVLERLRDGLTSVENAAAELDRLWAGMPLAREVLGLVEPAGERQPGGAPAAPPPQPPAAEVDRILDMVDTGTRADAASPPAPRPRPAPPAAAPPPEAKSKLGSFIAAVAKSGSKGTPGVRPEQGMRRVERALGLQIGAILQHPEIRRIEQAWRGVHFLASRAGTHAGIRLELVSARPADFPEALDGAIKANAGVEPPVSFAVVGDTIDGSAASLARLRALAEVAEQNAVPLVLDGAAGIFGVASLTELDRLDNKAKLYEAPERAPWRACVERPAARWVSVALNRMLGRGPYDRRSSRVRQANVEEMPNDEQSYVWLGACWAVAALAVTSFRKTGWPCRITGPRNGGTLEDLPVRQLVLSYEGVETVAIPTECFVSTETQRAMARYGALVLATAPNSDEIYLMTAPTAYVMPAKKTYDSETTEPEQRLPPVSLGDQLFAARLAQFLRALGGRLPSGSDPARLEPVLEAALRELFSTAPPGRLEIGVKVASDGSSFCVTVRPQRFLGVRLEEIALEIPLA
ncbi:MAG: type VI secretion system contractile sheath large subunit [Deltaproteobacteria bacterium]|nr:type VI secretion system contractile sheath large subunit [Deltaproteobacteria bacterium]